MEIINVENLTKDYEYYEKEQGLVGSVKNLFARKKLIKQAVNGISFTVSEGEIVGFLGPNGAGKTTTLKMLSGILFPTSGTATVNGFVPWERRKQYKMSFSIVMGQKSQLWWDLPAIESFYLNKCIYELDEDDYKKTVRELADALDVSRLLNVQVRRLSLGERMKMELIASLIHRPKIIFLDEPTIGLDIVSQKRIREFIKYYNDKNHTTILLTSHYMNDIEALCGRTIVINRGCLVYDGALDGINKRFSSQKLIKLNFSESVLRGDIERYGGICEYSGESAVIAVDKVDAQKISREIFDSLPVVDFNIEDRPVEDAVARLYKEGDAT